MHSKGVALCQWLYTEYADLDDKAKSDGHGPAKKSKRKMLKKKLGIKEGASGGLLTVEAGGPEAVAAAIARGKSPALSAKGMAGAKRPPHRKTTCRSMIRRSNMRPMARSIRSSHGPAPWISSTLRRSHGHTRLATTSGCAGLRSGGAPPFYSVKSADISRRACCRYFTRHTVIPCPPLISSSGCHARIVSQKFAQLFWAVNLCDSQSGVIITPGQ